MNIKDKPIEDMDLSIRTYNNCKRAGIKTIGDILEMPISARPHVGYKSMCEVKGVLKSKYGIELDVFERDDPIGFDRSDEDWCCNENEDTND